MKPNEMLGFTLVELLVVLAILGLLVGLVGPQVMKHLGRAKGQTATLQIADLSAALDAFYLDVGRYPTTDEGLLALVQTPATAVGWNGPYLKKKSVPKDPWAHDYVYQAPATAVPYDLLSFGADGVAGGEGDNADLRYDN